MMKRLSFASSADEFGWYNRSCAINPYLIEGKKTISMRFEQLTEALYAVVAVGDGHHRRGLEGL